MTVATRKPKPIPSAASPREQDFYAWSLAQAEHLRARRFDALDTNNLAEEIEGLGRGEFNKLTSALRVLMTHILKWDHQAERRSRSWINTIKTQRLEIDDLLTDNPALGNRFDEAADRAYRQARLAASTETGLEPEAFPDTLPYDRDALTARDFIVG